MDLYDKLKKYFDETPKEQVLKDWEETKGYDNVNSPTVEQFLLHSVSQRSELFCKCTTDTDIYQSEGFIKCQTCYKPIKMQDCG